MYLDCISTKVAYAEKMCQILWKDWYLEMFTLTDYKWNWTIQLFETGTGKNCE